MPSRQAKMGDCEDCNTHGILLRYRPSYKKSKWLCKNCYHDRLAKHFPQEIKPREKD